MVNAFLLGFLIFMITCKQIKTEANLAEKWKNRLYPAY